MVIVGATVAGAAVAAVASLWRAASVVVCFFAFFFMVSCLLQSRLLGGKFHVGDAAAECGHDRNEGCGGLLLGLPGVPDLPGQLAGLALLPSADRKRICGSDGGARSFPPDRLTVGLAVHGDLRVLCGWFHLRLVRFRLSLHLEGREAGADSVDSFQGEP